MNSKARAAVLGALAASVAPDPVVTVADWAAENRWIASEASSRPGKWTNGLTPYLVEVMDALSFSDPCREVVFKKSAQIGATEVGLNWLGSIIDRTPMPVLVALPNFQAVGEYSTDKLDKAIEATPVMRRRVLARKQTSRQGSSTRVKRFLGGSIRLVNASSSADSQMKSARALMCEEVTEYPANVKGMGDPVSSLRQRTEGYARTRKIYFVSTPGIKGSCRISVLYEASDQGRYYVPCPSCGCYQVLLWDRLKWRSDVPPYQPYMKCAAHGCIIEAADKRGMVDRGVWIRCFPGTDEDPAPPDAFEPEDLSRWRARRDPYRARGFWLWRVYSPFSGWEDIVREYLEAKGDPQEEKQFFRQVRGEEYEQIHDIPAHQVLWARREPLPTAHVPPWCSILTAATDVQGNRLEWAVYGWDVHLAPTVVDFGIIEGDPQGDDVWAEHDKVMGRTWRDAWGRAIPVEHWGIDSGGHATIRVYRYCREHAARMRPRIHALKGAPGWEHPALGSATPQDITFQGRKIGVVSLWSVGTWPLKAQVSRALRLTEQGRDATGAWPTGAARFPERCSVGFFEQLTAEACVERAIGKNGRTVREWVRIAGRPNEQLDLLVYAWAMAEHARSFLTTAQWLALAEKRRGPDSELQPDLLELAARTLRVEAREAEAAPATTVPGAVAAAANRGRSIIGSGRRLA